MYPYVPEEILLNAAQMVVWFVTVAVGLLGGMIAVR